MDIEYLLFLQNLRESLGGRFDSFFAFITTIAVDHWIIVPIFILFWAVDKRKGSQAALSLGFSLFFNAMLKAAFCVYRPWVRDARVKPLESVMSGATGYSFPSGHATCAGGFWGGLAFAYKKYKGFVVFCIFMILLVMFSRNFVGVHTPQDVLVGVGTGLLVSFVIDKVMTKLDEKPELDVWVMAAAVVFCIIGLCYVRFKSYPVDIVDGKVLVDPATMTVNSFKDPGSFFGFVSGWFLERRFVKFSTDGTPMEKVMRSLVGGLLYIFIQQSIIIPAGKALASGIAYFFFFALNNCIFMTLYPYLALKFEAWARKRQAARATESKTAYGRRKAKLHITAEK